LIFLRGMKRRKWKRDMRLERLTNEQLDALWRRLLNKQPSFGGIGFSRRCEKLRHKITMEEYRRA